MGLGGRTSNLVMKKNVGALVVLAIAVVVVMGIKNGKRELVEQATGFADGSYTLPVPVGEPLVEAVTQDAVTKHALPKLLDLGASKCIPCKLMAPILEEMKNTFAGSMDVEFIDVWENQGAGDKYSLRIIPTQIFFDSDGNELFRHEGFFAREDMLSKWQELGFSFEGKE